jgi:hypothetical protein
MRNTNERHGFIVRTCWTALALTGCLQGETDFVLHDGTGGSSVSTSNSGTGGIGGNSNLATGGARGTVNPALLPCASRVDAVRARPLDRDRCPIHATVADYERNMMDRTCGGVVCHRPNTQGIAVSEPIMPRTDIFVYLAGVKNHGTGTVYADTHPFGACPNDRYIDLDDPRKSLVLAKTQQARPACPSDGVTSEDSAQMPAAGPKLTTEESDCLQAYVEAVADGCK